MRNLVCSPSVIRTSGSCKIRVDVSVKIALTVAPGSVALKSASPKCFKLFRGTNGFDEVVDVVEVVVVVAVVVVVLVVLVVAVEAGCKFVRGANCTVAV